LFDSTGNEKQEVVSISVPAILSMIARLWRRKNEKKNN